MGSLNVIEAARPAGARKVVFASSGGTIYGDRSPTTTSRSPRPTRRCRVSPYGVAKKASATTWSPTGNCTAWSSRRSRLANVYGPRQDPHGEAGVVAIFAGRLLAGEQCTDLRRRRQTRDYVFVDDVVDAFARAAERGGGLVLNIGTGTETSVVELYRVMAAAAGVEVDPTFAEARLGEVARSALDAARAELQLGWRPWTTLAEGTAQVLDYFRDQRT